MEITYENSVSFLFVIVTYFLFRRNYVIYLFDVVTIFVDVRISLYFGTFKLRTEMTWKLRFMFFVIVTYFLLHHNYVICLFDVVTFFNVVRITLYFGSFGILVSLRMEITLQLRLVFVSHCSVFFITSQFCYIDVITFFDELRYTLLELRYIWYVWITYGQNGHFLVTFVCNQKMTKNIPNCYVIC